MKEWKKNMDTMKREKIQRKEKSAAERKRRSRVSRKYLPLNSAVNLKVLSNR